MKTEVLKILSHSVNEERTYKYNTHCAFLKCTRQTCTTTSQLAPLFGTLVERPATWLLPKSNSSAETRKLKGACFTVH